MKIENKINFDWINIWLVFIFSFLIIASRNSFNALEYPPLFLEDGRDLFPIFYNEHNIKDIFRYYGGYISVLPNLLAYFLTYLPIKLIPISFVITAYSISSLTFICVYKLTTNTFQNKAFALYTTFAIALLPLGNLFLVDSLMFQIWNFGVILFILILMPVSKNQYYKIILFIIINLLIWSNPISLLIAPICFYWFLKFPKHRAYYLLLILSIIFYFLIGIEAKETKISSLEFIPMVIAERVVIDSIVGPLFRSHLSTTENELTLILYPIVSLILFFLLFNWRNRSIREWEVIISSIYIIIFATAFSILGRKLGNDFASDVWGQRYVIIPKTFFLVLFFYSIYHLIYKNITYTALHIFVIVLLLYINLENKFLYISPIEGGKNLSKFLHSASIEKSQCHKNNNQNKFMTHNRNEWSIKIKIC